MLDTIKYLIKEEINKIINEAGEASSPPEDTTAMPPDASGSQPASDMSADMGSDTSTPSMSPGGAPMDSGLGGGSDPIEDDVSGGGGEDMGGGFGGGGGGLGKIGDSSEDGGGGGPGEGSTGTSGETVEPTEPDESKPPKEQIMSVAKDIAEKTNDVQKTIKSVKHLIQLRYNKPTDAVDVVLDLYNEKDNPVLQSVARRLAMFITGK